MRMVGTHTVSYAVRDTAGNLAEATRSVTIRDTRGPDLLLLKAGADCAATLSLDVTLASFEQALADIQSRTPGGCNALIERPGGATRRSATQLLEYDPGAVAVDMLYGDATATVSASGWEAVLDNFATKTSVDVEIQYTATDPTGNVGTATRRVRVVDLSPPAWMAPPSARMMAHPIHGAFTPLAVRAAAPRPAAAGPAQTPRR